MIARAPESRILSPTTKVVLRAVQRAAVSLPFFSPGKFVIFSCPADQGWARTVSYLGDYSACLFSVTTLEPRTWNFEVDETSVSINLDLILSQSQDIIKVSCISLHLALSRNVRRITTRFMSSDHSPCTQKGLDKVYGTFDDDFSLQVP